jgi:hypothetical protein
LHPRALHAAFCLIFVAACAGDDDTTSVQTTGASTGTGMVDTRYHPEPNGAQITETEACIQLQTVIQDKIENLGCTKTSPTCPNLLRAYYQPACMKYDQGTVQGCIDYFNDKFQCVELDESQCVLIAYPETAPTGCP